MEAWAIYHNLDIYGFINITSSYSEREILVALNVLLHEAFRMGDLLFNRENDAYILVLHKERGLICSMRKKTATIGSDFKRRKVIFKEK